MFDDVSKSVYSPDVTSQVKVDVVSRSASLVVLMVNVESWSPPDCRLAAPPH